MFFEELMKIKGIDLLSYIKQAAISHSGNDESHIDYTIQRIITKNNMETLRLHLLDEDDVEMGTNNNSQAYFTDYLKLEDLYNKENYVLSRKLLITCLLKLIN